MRTLVLILVALVLLGAPSARAQLLEITHIRVGQGDATLIEGPAVSGGARVRVLFDSGNISNPDGGALVARALADRGIRELDYFIVSHDDADHIGGAASGGVHGSSFILGLDRSVGNPGDDDGDGQVDWLDGARFVDPDPEELGRGDDVRVRRFADYGDALCRGSRTLASASPCRSPILLT